MKCFILIYFTIHSIRAADYKLYFYTVQKEYNKDSIEWLYSNIYNNKTLNEAIKILTDIQNPHSKLEIVFYFQNNRQATLISREFGHCKLDAGTKQIIKWMRDGINDMGNFSLPCPVYRNVYAINNLTWPINKLPLPSKLPSIPIKAVYELFQPENDNYRDTFLKLTYKGELKRNNN